MYTTEEQAEHRKQWAEALRSGKYEQGRNVLRKGDKFCCLGVACDISGLGQWEQEGYTDYVYNTNRGCNRVELVEMVKNWLGVTTRSVDIYNGVFNDSLISLNDSGINFITIADIIESDWIRVQK